MEANFGENFAGAGPATPTVIASQWRTDDPAQIGEPVRTEPRRRADRCSSSTAAWSPPANSRPAGRRSGRYRRRTGYEVAFGHGAGANEYVVWNTDINGDYTSAATGVLSGTSYALEKLEATFGEDLNGDGTIGPTMTTIATNGATDLTRLRTSSS